jgi:hypothetical protein
MHKGLGFGPRAFFWLLMFIITNKKIGLLAAIIIAMLLSGCANDPLRLGIAESEWENYNIVEQQKLFANYRQIVAEHSSVVKDKSKDFGDIFLDVSIYGGKVMMPPFINWSVYKPVKFRIFKGKCCNIVLSHATDATSQTELAVCFYGNTLYLDPSYYDLTKKDGSISIHFSPLWLSGFSYKEVSSSGYVRLKDVTIEIKQAEI